MPTASPIIHYFFFKALLTQSELYTPFGVDKHCCGCCGGGVHEFTVIILCANMGCCGCFKFFCTCILLLFTSFWLF